MILIRISFSPPSYPLTLPLLIQPHGDLEKALQGLKPDPIENAMMVEVRCHSCEQPLSPLSRPPPKQHETNSLDEGLKAVIVCVQRQLGDAKSMLEMGSGAWSITVLSFQPSHSPPRAPARRRA